MAAAATLPTPELKAYLQPTLTTLFLALGIGDETEEAPGGFCFGFSLWVLGKLLKSDTSPDRELLLSQIEALIALEKTFLAFEKKNFGDPSLSIPPSTRIKAMSEDIQRFYQPNFFLIEQARSWLKQISDLQTSEKCSSFIQAGFTGYHDVLEKPDTAFKITFGEEISTHSTPHYGIYDQDEFTAFLNLVTSERASFYLSLHTLRHAVALWYDQSRRSWNIADANQGLQNFANAAKLAEFVFNTVFSWKSEPLLNFEMRLMSPKPIAPYFAKLKAGDAWQELHRSPKHLHPEFRSKALKRCSVASTRIHEKVSWRSILTDLKTFRDTFIRAVKAGTVTEKSHEWIQTNPIHKAAIYLMSERGELPKDFITTTGFDKADTLYLLTLFCNPEEKQNVLETILTKRDTFLSQFFWMPRGNSPCSTSRGVLREVKEMYDACKLAAARQLPSPWALLFHNRLARPETEAAKALVIGDTTPSPATIGASAAAAHASAVTIDPSDPMMGFAL